VLPLTDEVESEASAAAEESSETGAPAALDPPRDESATLATPDSPAETESESRDDSALSAAGSDPTVTFAEEPDSEVLDVEEEKPILPRSVTSEESS
jgi:hypothetical protein